MIHFVLMISSKGKVRLAKWYSSYSESDKERIVREVSNSVIGRSAKLCNFLEWQDFKLVWRRYTGLHIVTCIDKEDNELIQLESIQHYVEALDKHFGQVCELDLIFNFPRAYHILDEVFAAGELQEASRTEIQKLVNHQENAIKVCSYT